MNRTKIEWCDYTWNPLTGCNGLCPYCYARVMAKRLRGRFGYPYEDPFKVTFHPKRLKEPREVKKPSKIFTCSMGELYDPKSSYTWIQLILTEMARNKQHTFILPSKKPEALSQFSYPSNLWLGVSIDGLTLEVEEALNQLRKAKYDFNNNYYGAKTIFVSFEPLLKRLEPDLIDIDWIIIGGQTGHRKFTPNEEWVATLTRCAREAGAKAFHKDNIPWGWSREFPDPIPIEEVSKLVCPKQGCNTPMEGDPDGYWCPKCEEYYPPDIIDEWLMENE